MSKYFLFSTQGIIAQDNARNMIDRMLKNNTASHEFPEFKDKQITGMRPVGEPEDSKTALELLNLGLPIIVFYVDGQEAYGIPLSLRSRIDTHNQTIATLN